ncbi:MAG TPA: NAD(P)-dependent oxidoreductase [Bryobacteraceae bacterium]|nr:NAD(P)-dependent oxidoreductase [Bryobacteraceae bacterium]
MPYPFKVGVTPDFYTDAKGRFEGPLEQKLSSAPNIQWEAMPPQPGKFVGPDAVRDFDAIFALGIPFTRESMQGAGRLALIARWGVGYDMIDMDAITEANVLLAITPNAVRRPVAEAILTCIFMLSKNVLEQDRTVRAGKWRGELSRLGTCLAGRTLGSLGCGNIASEMFRLAGGLGFSRFIAHDPYADRAAAAKRGVELVSLPELFSDSDFVTVNCLLNAQTRGLIGETQLRMMKPTAFFINTARGPIVRQKDLTRALQERWIAGAGIDVFEKEPPDADDPLLQLDNVVLAPHALAWTEEIARDNGLEACDNILALARGEIPHGAVNMEVLSKPGFQKKLERYRS